MVVGGFSSVIGDSILVPSLCFDSVFSCFRSRQISRYSLAQKRVQRLELMSSSYSSSSRALLCTVLKKNLTRKRRINTSLVIVNELAGQYEDSFEDIKTHIVDYFTYKAVKTVLIQLYEMNPPQYLWFYKYVASNERGYGKGFIRDLAKVQHSLAERVMITRLHLYGKWIKECDHAEMYQKISDQNLELMRQRLIDTVVWPSDDSDVVG